MTPNFYRAINFLTRKERSASACLAILFACLLWLALVLSFNLSVVFSPGENRPIIVDIIPVPPEPPLRPSPPQQISPKAAHEVDAPGRPSPRQVEQFDAFSSPLPSPSVTSDIPPAPPQPTVTSSIGSGGVGQGSGRSTGNGTGGGGGRALAPVSWAIVPDDVFFNSIYPDRARNEKVTGWATLRCELVWNKRVRKCRIVAESPTGYGFGKAMLHSSDKLRINPPQVEGRRVRLSKIDIRLDFDLQQ